MSVYYKPTDFIRITNFMGYPDNPEHYIPIKLFGKPEYNLELSKVRKAAENDKLSITDVVKIWDKSTGLERLGIDGKLELANKLEQVCLKNSRDCFITKLFFRIVGIFKGRGFKTEGEWGLQKARQIRKQQLDHVKMDIKSFLINPQNGLPPYFYQIVNKLSVNDFKSLFEISFFNHVEGANNLHPAKFHVIEYLGAEKLDLFFKLILERSDWFEQIVDVDGAALLSSEEALETVYQRAGMFAHKFMEDQKSILDWYNKKFPGFRMHEQDYFGLLLQMSIRGQLMNGSFKPSFVEPYKKIIAQLTPILSPEELTVLENQGIKFNKS